MDQAHCLAKLGLSVTPESMNAYRVEVTSIEGAAQQYAVYAYASVLSLDSRPVSASSAGAVQWQRRQCFSSSTLLWLRYHRGRTVPGVSRLIPYEVEEWSSRQRHSPFVWRFKLSSIDLFQTARCQRDNLHVRP